MRTLLYYLADEQASEAVEKMILVGGVIIVSTFVAGFIGKMIGEQLKLLDES